MPTYGVIFIAVAAFWLGHFHGYRKGYNKYESERVKNHRRF